MIRRMDSSLSKEPALIAFRRILKTIVFAAAAAVGLAACASSPEPAKEGEWTASIDPGPSWMHRFSALMTNPPQFVLWAEGEDGTFLGTVYATRKVATEGWIFSGGNRRPESLPVWGHRRGIAAADGVYLPTKEAPLTDAVTGATPRGRFSVAVDPAAFAGAAGVAGAKRFYLYAEFNHSTDFNPSYPKDAKEGEGNYTGGAYGSGQPSVVYRALIDPEAASDAVILELIGHGSPDGSDGAVYRDTGSLTTALSIVDRITARKARQTP